MELAPFNFPITVPNTNIRIQATDSRGSSQTLHSDSVFPLAMGVLVALGRARLVVYHRNYHLRNKYQILARTSSLAMA